jgi:hypothetical protein
MIVEEVEEVKEVKEIQERWSALSPVFCKC